MRWSPVPQTKHFCRSFIQECRIDELLPTLLFISGIIALDCKTETKWVYFPSSCVSISSAGSSVRCQCLKQRIFAVVSSKNVEKMTCCQHYFSSAVSSLWTVKHRNEMGLFSKQMCYYIFCTVFSAALHVIREKRF